MCAGTRGRLTTFDDNFACWGLNNRVLVTVFVCICVEYNK